MDSTTPASPEQVTRPVPLWVKFGLFALGNAVFFGLLLLGAVPVPQHELSIWDVVLLLILFVAPFGPLIIIHECGHLIAGVLVGFRFQLIVFGPVQITRTIRGVRIERNRIKPLRGAGVSCPPESEHHLLRNMAIFIAGGPVVTLLVGLVGMVFVARHLWHQELPFDEAILLVATTYLALILTIMALIPTHVEGMASDGDHLITLLKGGSGAA